jgi:hypothetical protein
MKMQTMCCRFPSRLRYRHNERGTQTPGDRLLLSLFRRRMIRKAISQCRYSHLVLRPPTGGATTDLSTSLLRNAQIGRHPAPQASEKHLTCFDESCYRVAMTNSDDNHRSHLCHHASESPKPGTRWLANRATVAIAASGLGGSWPDWNQMRPATIEPVIQSFDLKQ